MQLKFKTLRQETFTLDADGEELVSAVKEKLKNAQPQFCGESQLKFIYSGRIMEDDKTLNEYKVTEVGFIVVMIQVIKPQRDNIPEPIKKVAPPLPAASSSAVPEVATPTNPPEQPSFAAPTDPEPARGSETPVLSGESALVVGNELEEVTKMICEMGFERDKVIQALHASFNNPNRAVEYLVSGNLPAMIPERPAPRDAPAAPLDSVGEQSDVPDIVNQNPEGAQLIQLLSQVPQFQQLRALRGNPQLLSQLIQQLHATNPDIFRLIESNEQAFLDFINSDDTGSTPEGERPAQPQVPSMVIRLTQEEKSAIDRLKALGFSEDLVIQAYFACDKNEELAADFLFSDSQNDAV